MQAKLGNLRVYTGRTFYLAFQGHETAVMLHIVFATQLERINKGKGKGKANTTNTFGIKTRNAADRRQTIKNPPKGALGNALEVGKSAAEHHLRMFLKKSKIFRAN